MKKMGVCLSVLVISMSNRRASTSIGSLALVALALLYSIVVSPWRVVVEVEPPLRACGERWRTLSEMSCSACSKTIPPPPPPLA